MDISNYISYHNNNYKKKLRLRKTGIGILLSPFAITIILMLVSLFVKSESLLAPFFYFSGLWFMVAIVVGSVMIILSNKKYKNATIIDRCIIYSYGFKIPGQLHEEVGITMNGTQYHYYTLSEYDRMNAGGESAEIPAEFVSGQDVDVDSLLIYISQKHPYMESLRQKKQCRI